MEFGNERCERVKKDFKFTLYFRTDCAFFENEFRLFCLHRSGGGSRSCGFHSGSGCWSCNGFGSRRGSRSDGRGYSRGRSRSGSCRGRRCFGRSFFQLCIGCGLTGVIGISRIALRIFCRGCRNRFRSQPGLHGTGRTCQTSVENGEDKRDSQKGEPKDTGRFCKDVSCLRAKQVVGHSAAESRAEPFVFWALHERQENEQNTDDHVERQKDIDENRKHEGGQYGGGFRVCKAHFAENTEDVRVFQGNPALVMFAKGVRMRAYEPDDPEG